MRSINMVLLQAWTLGIVTITCGLMFSSAAVQAQMPATGLTVKQTSVIRFTPEIPVGDVREGSCWTESIAVPRHGAWRCAVGNGISDPCFAVPANHKQLVCDANPALKTGGFLLKLTKPLPKTSLPDKKAEPWIFQLTDSSICQAMTGTLPAVNGEPARWSCAIHIRGDVRPDGVVTALKPGKIWMADKFPESAIGFGPSGAKNAVPARVPVKVVWE